MFEPLRDGRYRLLWLTGLSSNTARWMDVVVLGWLALTLTDLAPDGGRGRVLPAVPMMALGPFAGVLAIGSPGCG